MDNDYGSSDIGTVLSAQGVTENPETAEDYGFGSHFMTMEDEEELAEPPTFQVKFGFIEGSLFILRGLLKQEHCFNIFSKAFLGS